MLGPDQRTNPLEERCARGRQLNVVLGNLTHQPERERIAIQIDQAVLIEVNENMVCIHLRVALDQEGFRLSAAQWLERENGGIGAVDLAQVRDTTLLPFACAA